MPKVPKSWDSVCQSEFRDFMSSLDGAIEKETDQRFEEETEITRDDLNKVSLVGGLLQVSLQLIYDSYVKTGIGDLISLYDVIEKPTGTKLSTRRAKQRPSFESYLSSLRGLIQGVQKSYLMTSGFDAFDLGEFRRVIISGLLALANFIKYVEPIVTWTEKYLSWIEYAANLASKYDHVMLDKEEEDSEINESYYSDPRVQLYAILKTTDFDPDKLVNFLSDLRAMLFQFASLTGTLRKLFAEIDPKEFSKIFPLLDSKKSYRNNEASSRYENLEKLTDYFRTRIKASIDSTSGTLFLTKELLESAIDTYLADYIDRVGSLIKLVPTRKDQKRFIQRFEKGLMWPEPEDDEEN